MGRWSHVADGLRPVPAPSGAGQVPYRARRSVFVGPPLGWLGSRTEWSRAAEVAAAGRVGYKGPLSRAPGNPRKSVSWLIKKPKRRPQGAAKKPAKPVVKKWAAKPVAKKRARKPVTKAASSHPAARKATAKKTPVKATKPVAKKAAAPAKA